MEPARRQHHHLGRLWAVQARIRPERRGLSARYRRRRHGAGAAAKEALIREKWSRQNRVRARSGGVDRGTGISEGARPTARSLASRTRGCSVAAPWYAV